MTGFFGTQQQQALQRQTQLMAGWIAETPGVYNAGRFMGIDDPSRFGPDELDRMLRRDGLLGLRMISPAQAERHFTALEAKGCRIDSWDILVGGPEGAGMQASRIAAGPLPDGLGIQTLDEPQSVRTVRVQQFLAANGLAPFPGSMLVTAPPLARTIILGTGDRVCATGHAYFPHNAHSPFRDHAWIGLIAVDEAWRGRGLGRLVNALLVRAAFEELGARRVYEMVAPSNEPSRRMVESCGLRLDPTLRCGVAMSADAERFTR